MKKNLLIISTISPLENHVASNRINSFIKYIDSSLFNITLITRKTPNSKNIKQVSGIEIIEISYKSSFFSFKPSENKYIHIFKALINKIIVYTTLDSDAEFTKKAIKTATDLQEKKKFSVVLTSFGPIASLLIGLEFKKKYPLINWVCDLRDELTQNKHLPWHWRIYYKNFEQLIFKTADLVTVVSFPILEFLKKNSEISHGTTRFMEVRNGYDFKEIIKKHNRTDSNHFKICFTGTFYGDINPDLFMQSLQKLIKNNPNVKIQFIIYGGNSSLKIPTELKNNIFTYPRVEYSSIQKILNSMDLLLLIYPSNGRKGVYTTKLFDYLTVNVPILGLVDPQDVAGELIRLCNAGAVEEYTSSDKVYQHLQFFLNAHKKNNNLYERNWDEVEKNHRQFQINKINDYLAAK